MRKHTLPNIGGRVPARECLTQRVAGHCQSVEDCRSIIGGAQIEIRATGRAGKLPSPRLGIGFQRLKDVAQKSMHHVQCQVRSRDRGGVFGHGEGAFVDLV
jgi:hypothetical protein